MAYLEQLDNREREVKEINQIALAVISHCQSISMWVEGQMEPEEARQQLVNQLRSAADRLEGKKNTPQHYSVAYRRQFK